MGGSCEATALTGELPEAGGVPANRSAGSDAALFFEGVFIGVGATFSNARSSARTISLILGESSSSYKTVEATGLGQLLPVALSASLSTPRSSGVPATTTGGEEGLSLVRSASAAAFPPADGAGAVLRWEGFEVPFPDL